eukprot:194121_1
MAFVFDKSYLHGIIKILITIISFIILAHFNLKPVIDSNNRTIEWYQNNESNISHCSTMVESTNMHFLRTNETEQKFLYEYPSYLFSHPGSGNTFTRILIEYITEIWSGSVYNDSQLRKSGGFKGEGRCSQQYEVLIVKAHPAGMLNRISEDGTNLTKPCIAKPSCAVCATTIWTYTTAIFIVRNPWKSIFALFQYQSPEYLNMQKRVNRHTYTIPMENWNMKLMKMFIKMFNQHKKTWLNTFIMIDVYKRLNYSYIIVKFVNFFDEKP